MTSIINIGMLAASLFRFLDPYTSVFQTDEDDKCITLAREEGYWPVMQGLKDPTAQRPVPNIVHTVFRRSETPFPDWQAQEPSPLFKVNQVGYLPEAPKFAYIGAWLGPKFGAWRPHTPMTSWRLVRAGDGTIAFSSPEGPKLKIKDEIVKGIPSTGEETYEMDFSGVSEEGEYYIEVDGVGRSDTFRISSASAEDAFRVHMQGLYQKRCAIAKGMPCTHWPAAACHQRVTRGTFAPDDGKLEPKCKWFDIIRTNTDWDKGEKVTVIGGWHDAADYDRRPQHLAIVNDLCAIYIARRQNFRDGQLYIPENANGIADILDEADWGLAHILAGQQADGGAGTWIEGTRHPMPGNVAANDSIKYAIAKATRRSSLMYAANASLLARCDDSFRAKYLESAKKAWNFAVTTRPRREVYEIKKTKNKIFTETSLVYWSEDESLPTGYLVKAAVNLAALTGDKSYIEFVKKDYKKALSDLKTKAWNWPPLLYTGEMALGVPEELGEYFAAWRSRITKQADSICAEMDNSYAYRIPWPKMGDKKSQPMGWGLCHPLRRALRRSCGSIPWSCTFIRASSKTS